MTDVVGLGSGGHARVVVEILRLVGGYSVKGVLDPARPKGSRDDSGLVVLGDDASLPALVAEGLRAVFIGVGGARSTDIRQKLFEFARAAGCDVVKAIHPHAVISPSAAIGDNVTINTGAIVEHDCRIEDHVHVATGARVGGGSRIGAGAHVGIGAVLREGITVGQRALVGAGAVVVDDVPAAMVVAGNPARIMRPV
jgi:acetyltransferase-like isoleucine patch superfamily enzyme